MHEFKNLEEWTAIQIAKLLFERKKISNNGFFTQTMSEIILITESSYTLIKHTNYHNNLGHMSSKTKIEIDECCGSIVFSNNEINNYELLKIDDKEIKVPLEIITSDTEDDIFTLSLLPYYDRIEMLKIYLDGISQYKINYLKE